MPLYSYECKHCRLEIDSFQRLKDFEMAVPCPQCGGMAGRVITNGHGGIQTDGDVTWLPSAVDALQPDGERRIETRGQFKNYLKKNEIVQRA